MYNIHGSARVRTDFLRMFGGDALLSLWRRALTNRRDLAEWRSGRIIPRIAATALILALSTAFPAWGQETPNATQDDRQEIRQLRSRVAGLELQINELKALIAKFVQMPEASRAELLSNPANEQVPAERADSLDISPTKPVIALKTQAAGGPPGVKLQNSSGQATEIPVARESNGQIEQASVDPPKGSPIKLAKAQEAQAEEALGANPEKSPEHTMAIPGGGPTLKIRGFLDFNLGVGTDANPLIYPLNIPAKPVHNTFQFGEFDLFMTSQLSDSISFLSEVVFGADASNFWGIDIERAQITYKPNDYFQISGGRFHTSIGYYNTAFHHGTWFQTATGRPFMDFFEDSGGILPVHSVGITTTGLMPGTGKLNLHWIAEVGNGESSSYIGQPIVNQPVQNFLSDKNHKAFNLAGYIKPDWVPGLQIGGSYYNDEMVPAGVPHVDQNIESVYAVYITPVWEFMNEFVEERNKSVGQSKTFDTPLGYTQLSRKFGKYRPYFRYQYVKVPSGDPLYSAAGKYVGPSVGLRIDFTNYVALKVQYNRLYTLDPLPKNGLDGQVSFTF